MSVFFYNRSTLFWFISYLIIQVVICYVYGGWLIGNIFNMDSLSPFERIFFMTTDVSILFAALLSLSSLVMLKLRLLSRILLLINAITYVGVIIYDFISPPPTYAELLLYLLSSLLIIFAYIIYDALVYKVQLKNEIKHAKV
ncbi:hypothetical protein L3V83_08900 [Thiotrichales bacterium 19X7-9]|nr:hypothetical protein [Thiotrichales bacterium 19X7-9]